MIHESHYWKDPLLKMAKRIERYQERESLTERQAAQLERDLFLGFYSVRKLFEAGPKISDETRKIQLSLRRHPKCVGAPITDLWNRYEIAKLFDLDSGTEESRDAGFVANRIIHSFIFLTQGPSEDCRSGVYFSSDRDKDNNVYFLDTQQIVHLFGTVGNDYPNLSHMWRDPVTGEIRWEARTMTEASPNISQHQ